MKKMHTNYVCLRLPMKQNCDDKNEIKIAEIVSLNLYFQKIIN